MNRALAVLAVVAGCTDRYGAYLEIDGRTGNLAFDRVEFHFGKYLDDTIPSTPATPIASPPVVQKGSLFKRAFEASDVQQLGARDTTFVYYLGANGQEQYLGAYVVAVAFAGDQPVGVAELTDFTIPGDAVHQYPMPLVPFFANEVELWGNATADCVKWTRMRDGDTAKTTFAVVRAEDHDCDGFTDEVDCAQLDYCPDASSSCPGHDPCIAGDTCAIGACTNLRGMPSAPRRCLAPTDGAVCLGPMACEACKSDAQIQKCLGDAPFSHAEITIPVTPQERLCSPTYPIPFPLPGGMACENPRIDLPLAGRWPDGFSVGVTADPMNAGTCKLAIVEPAGGAKFSGIQHHIVLSVTDGGVTSARTSLLFGILTKLAPCGTPPDVTDPSSVDVGRCN